MKLTELKPKYGAHQDGTRTHIVFDCPKCRGHRISVPFVGKVAWKKTGEDFNTTTLMPSIAHKTHYADEMDNPPRLCESHFFVTNGEIQMA